MMGGTKGRANGPVGEVTMMPAKEITVQPATRTIYRADQPWFADRQAALARLRRSGWLRVGRDGAISVRAGAVAEELDPEEREVVHKLLGYSWDKRYPLIAKRAGVVGGRAAVAGRRVPVWQIEKAARSGLSLAQLVSDFELSAEQVAQALGYARRHPEEISQDILDQETAAEHVRWVTVRGRGAAS